MLNPDQLAAALTDPLLREQWDAGLLAAYGTTDPWPPPGHTTQTGDPPPVPTQTDEDGMCARCGLGLGWGERVIVGTQTLCVRCAHR